ncbi:unnamed protein product, partial [marine sediment metagenome]
PTRSLRSAGQFASLFLQGLADQSVCFRAAAIIFSTGPRLMFDFSQFSAGNLSGAREILESLPYIGEYTRPSTALEFVQHNLLASRNSSAPAFVLLATDGLVQDAVQLIADVSNVQSAATLYGIGFGTLNTSALGLYLPVDHI